MNDASAKKAKTSSQINLCQVNILWLRRDASDAFLTVRIAFISEKSLDSEWVKACDDYMCVSEWANKCWLLVFLFMNLFVAHLSKRLFIKFVISFSILLKNVGIHVKTAKL